MSKATERDRLARTPKPREKRFCGCGVEIQWSRQTRCYIGVNLGSTWLCPACEGGS